MTYPPATKKEYLKAIKEGVQHMLPLNVTKEDYLKVVKEGVKEAILSSYHILDRVRDNKK